MIKSWLPLSNRIRVSVLCRDETGSHLLGYSSFEKSSIFELLTTVPCISLQRDNLVVGLAVVVVILQEEVLVCAVGSECDGSDAETGEESLEAVPPSEWTSVAPGLTIQLLVSRYRKPGGCRKRGSDRTCEPRDPAWPR